MRFESISGFRKSRTVFLLAALVGGAGCSDVSGPPADPGSTGADAVQAGTSLTVLEGHLRASKELSDRGRSGEGPDPALDLVRAGRHAAHPHHELLAGFEPDALALQELLRATDTLSELDAALTAYIDVSDQPGVSAETVESAFQRAMSATARAREAIAADAPADFWARAACGAMEVAAEEYEETAQSGRLEVEMPGEPGLDGFIEYQDARGFIQAAYGLSGNLNLTPEAREAFDTLLADVFPGPEPVDTNQLTPPATVNAGVERICGGIF